MDCNSRAVPWTDDPWMKCSLVGSVAKYTNSFWCTALGSSEIWCTAAVKCNAIKLNSVDYSVMLVHCCGPLDR